MALKVHSNRCTFPIARWLLLELRPVGFTGSNKIQPSQNWKFVIYQKRRNPVRRLPTAQFIIFSCEKNVTDISLQLFSVWCQLFSVSLLLGIFLVALSSRFAMMISTCKFPFQCLVSAFQCLSFVRNLSSCLV